MLKLNNLYFGGWRGNILVAQGLSGSFFTLFLRQLAQGDTKQSNAPPPPLSQLLPCRTVHRVMGCSPLCVSQG